MIKRKSGIKLLHCSIRSEHSEIQYETSLLDKKVR